MILLPQIIVNQQATAPADVVETSFNSVFTGITASFTLEAIVESSFAAQLQPVTALFLPGDHVPQSSFACSIQQVTASFESEAIIVSQFAALLQPLTASFAIEPLPFTFINAHMQQVTAHFTGTVVGISFFTAQASAITAVFGSVANVITPGYRVIKVMARSRVIKAGNLNMGKYYRIIDQDQNEYLDWQIDWSDIIRNDSIVASLWIADNGITANQTSATTSTTTVWIGSGRAGFSYNVTNRITTASGRTHECKLLFKITN